MRRISKQDTLARTARQTSAQEHQLWHILMHTHARKHHATDSAVSTKRVFAPVYGGALRSPPPRSCIGAARAAAAGDLVPNGRRGGAAHMPHIRHGARIRHIRAARFHVALIPPTRAPTRPEREGVRQLHPFPHPPPLFRLRGAGKTSELRANLLYARQRTADLRAVLRRRCRDASAPTCCRSDMVPVRVAAQW